jgi:hypothetical protein
MMRDRRRVSRGSTSPRAAARGALKALHLQARVHTFHGSGHVASIAKLDEYVAVIKHFLWASVSLQSLQAQGVGTTPRSEGGRL